MATQQASKQRSTIVISGEHIGFYDSHNGEFCENCGYKKPTKLVYKGIHNFGVRSVMGLRLCKRCEDC